MEIKGFIGTSLLDYPKKIGSIVFLGGCDFKCPFCQNPDLIDGGKNFPSLSRETLMEELITRKNFIDGVVISGGEPTIHSELPELIAEIKSIGFPVKLDTNGNNPEMIEKLLKEGLVDFIAMDVKTSFEKYSQAAGLPVDIQRIKKSIECIRLNAPDYEFRTTVVPTLVDEEDIQRIAEICRGSKIFYLHQFRSIITYDEEYEKIKSYTIDVLENYKKILLSTISEVYIRGL